MSAGHSIEWGHLTYASGTLEQNGVNSMFPRWKLLEWDCLEVLQIRMIYPQGRILLWDNMLMCMMVYPSPPRTVQAMKGRIPDCSAIRLSHFKHLLHTSPVPTYSMEKRKDDSGSDSTTNPIYQIESRYSYLID